VHQDLVNTISGLFKLLRDKWGIDCSITELSSLSSSEIERLKTDIRSIPPQVRGRIVTSRGHVLPLSKSKNLNLKNTPILILYREETVVDVYPHVLGSKYFNMDDALERMLRFGPDDYLQLRGLLEEPMVKILSDFPSILGRGVKSLGSEISVSTGKIDLLMEEEDGGIIVVEAENYADDFAVGQVCRLATGYHSQFDFPQDSIRKVIVCLDHSSTLPETCRGAGVELFRLVLKPMVDAISRST
jgi:hypothetical protein